MIITIKPIIHTILVWENVLMKKEGTQRWYIIWKWSFSHSAANFIINLIKKFNKLELEKKNIINSNKPPSQKKKSKRKIYLRIRHKTVKLKIIILGRINVFFNIIKFFFILLKDQIFFWVNLANKSSCSVLIQIRMIRKEVRQSEI